MQSFPSSYNKTTLYQETILHTAFFFPIVALKLVKLHFPPTQMSRHVCNDCHDTPSVTHHHSELISNV